MVALRPTIRTLIGSHTLPVKSKRQHTAQMTRNAWNCLLYLLTSALDLMAMQSLLPPFMSVSFLSAHNSKLLKKITPMTMRCNYHFFWQPVTMKSHQLAVNTLTATKTESQCRVCPSLRYKTCLVWKPSLVAASPLQWPQLELWAHENDNFPRNTGHRYTVERHWQSILVFRSPVRRRSTDRSDRSPCYVSPHPTGSCLLDKTLCTRKHQEVFRNQYHAPTTGHMCVFFTDFRNDTSKAVINDATTAALCANKH